MEQRPSGKVHTRRVTCILFSLPPTPMAAITNAFRRRPPKPQPEETSTRLAASASPRLPGPFYARQVLRSSPCGRPLRLSEPARTPKPADETGTSGLPRLGKRLSGTVVHPVRCLGQSGPLVVSAPHFPVENRHLCRFGKRRCHSHAHQPLRTQGRASTRPSPALHDKFPQIRCKRRTHTSPDRRGTQ
jgi:hypothetical protein